jgi:NADH dehydrogenase FAD-containing subunit
MSATASRPRQRVVIIGAGFAGLSAATALRHSPFDVIVIDRHNYHLFQPLLYQVATAALSPADIASPIRPSFATGKMSACCSPKSPASISTARKSSPRIIGSTSII